MTTPSAILLFAAGLGTRMGPLVADRPKPLVKVGGATLLDRTIAMTAIPEIKTRAINVHYKADMIRQHLHGQGLLFSDETSQLLETGGGLKHALSLLGQGPVITMNTDAVWSGANPIPQLLTAWKPKMDALLMLVPQQKAHGHKGQGDFLIGIDGGLTRGTGPIYTGLQIIRPDLLDTISDTCFSMNILWDKFIQRQSIFGITYDGYWCDVGQPDSIPIAERMLTATADV